LTILTKSAPLVRYRFSVRVYIIAIILAILVPTLISVGFLAMNSARSERAQLEQSAKDEAREATAAIERDLIGIENVLMTLAGSPSLRSGDIEAFYGQAADVSRNLGLLVTLWDVHLDAQVMNTVFPWETPLTGAALPPLSEVSKELLRSGTPVVSGVFFGALVKQYVVAVMVPVFRGKELMFFLSAGAPLGRFAEILESLNVGSGQIVGVVDHNGSFVARSDRNNEFVGARVLTPPPPDTQSVTQGVNREGIAMHFFHRRSALLDWIITVAEPDSILDAPFNRAITSLATAGGLLLAAAIALAYYWSGWISRSFGALGIDRKPTREEFEILFDSAPNGVMVVDSTGRIVMLNAQMTRTFGYPPNELIGEPVETLVSERFRRGHANLRQAFTLDPEARPMGAGRDLYGQRKDGTEFPVEIGLNPIRYSAGTLVMLTMMDISARKLAAERLSATTAERDDLRRRLIQAHEQERLHLARELHDQTGQGLTAVMLEMKGIESALSEPDRARLRLLRLQLEKVGQTLHHVAWELRPASIDELGLEYALANYVLEWGDQYGIAADFHSGDSKLDELTEEICTTVYRVVQEALTNIIKHARPATGVSVIIDRVNGELRLVIEDNGRGFDTSSSIAQRGSRNGGLGLAGMRERLSLIGGEFEVESSVGAGTTVFARIPLEQKRTAP
jgi:two-component system sensor histidine kinase UhpB